MDYENNLKKRRAMIN